MKKLFILSLLLFTVLSFGQIKIEPISIGWPAKQATDLMVRVMPFETTALTCDLYYELRDCDGSVLTNGNLSLSESQFAAWSEDNRFIENIALSKLLLTRKENE